MFFVTPFSECSTEGTYVECRSGFRVWGLGFRVVSSLSLLCILSMRVGLMRSLVAQDDLSAV